MSRGPKYDFDQTPRGLVTVNREVKDCARIHTGYPPSIGKRAYWGHGTNRHWGVVTAMVHVRDRVGHDSWIEFEVFTSMCEVRTYAWALHRPLFRVHVP